MVVPNYIYSDTSLILTFVLMLSLFWVVVTLTWRFFLGVFVLYFLSFHLFVLFKLGLAPHPRTELFLLLLLAISWLIWLTIWDISSISFFIHLLWLNSSLVSPKDTREVPVISAFLINLLFFCEILEEGYVIKICGLSAMWPTSHQFLSVHYCFPLDHSHQV